MGVFTDFLDILTNQYGDEKDRPRRRLVGFMGAMPIYSDKDAEKAKAEMLFGPDPDGDDSVKERTERDS